MEKSTLELLYDNSINHSEKKALISKNETLTYAQFWEEIRKCSAYLIQNGLKAGQIVLIKASQTPDYLICYYAIQLAGGIACSLEKNTPSSSVLEILKKMDGSMIISGKKADIKTDLVKTFLASSIRKEAALIDISGIDFKFPELDRTQIILFTTGTTGASKGVEISFGAMQASEEKIRSFLHMDTYAENGLFVTPTPLNHAKGIWEVGGMLRSGGSVYLLKNMSNLKEYFNALDYPCDKLLLSLVPANLRMLLMMAPDELSRRSDKIGGIKLGTAPLLEYDKNYVMGLLPKTELHNPYGSSEAGILCSYMFNENPGLAFCIGKPLQGTEVLIVDDDRKPIPSSSITKMGRLAFKSNSAMKGYYNEPELTKTILENGIIYTNDYGYIDKNGFVYIKGRMDDVINIGGLKVSPDEVEAEVIAFPGILDCICTSIKDPITGNALKLLVVLKEKGTLDPAAIKKFLTKKLEQYKIPKFYFEVDEIERTSNGKLNRKFYREN